MEVENPINNGDEFYSLPKNPTPLRFIISGSRVIHNGALIAETLEAKRTCELCNRVFFSVKALHGHMRVHGNSKPIKPENPEKRKKRKKNLDEAADFEEINRGSRSNGKKRRRVEGNIVGSCSYSLFPHWGTRQKRSSTEMISASDHASSSSSSSSMAIVPYVGGNPIQNPATEKEEVSTAIVPYTGGSQSSDQMHRTEIKAGGHLCKVCGASFRSHQALGGHMTKHRVKVSGGDDDDDNNKMKKKKKKKAAAEMSREHTCDVCGKVYAHGHQMGGHKRKHYIRKREERGFDLNQLPNEAYSYVNLEFGLFVGPILI